jgi:hypothetical protein
MAQRDAALLEPTVLLAFSAIKAQTIGTIFKCPFLPSSSLRLKDKLIID